MGVISSLHSALEWSFLLVASRLALTRDTPGGSSLVVTLTSYPARIGQVHRTVRTLLWQAEHPIVILYLALEQFPRRDLDLPPNLARLLRNQSRFEVRYVNSDTRSFKKLVPALTEFPDKCIVTADDDVLYRRGWLKTLVLTADRHPQTIVGTRGTTMTVEDGAFTTYSSWAPAPFNRSGMDVFLTGRGGILYPPRALDPIAAEISVATTVCPDTDDIWFKLAALAAGTPAVRADCGRELVRSTLRSQGGLYESNVNGHQNDRSLARALAHFGTSTVLAWIYPTCSSVGHHVEESENHES